ncbi:MAG: hypothetical protein ABSF77_07640 [Spirochaetia bacterium]|jgi:hypothetical protein
MKARSSAEREHGGGKVKSISRKNLAPQNTGTTRHNEKEGTEERGKLKMHRGKRWQEECCGKGSFNTL